MVKFIGRHKEFKALKGLLRKTSSSLVVIRGRRRIGKSRLVEEFANSFNKSIILSGIPPEDGVTAEDQRKEFVRQLQEYRLPVYRSDDWGNLFFDLAEVAKSGKILICLDEITWMGSKDPTFLPKLKTAWDRHFKKNPKLILIISGSNSAWISKNILSSTGFFGRVSLKMRLEELTLSECNAFWDSWPGVVSPYEKFKILSVMGGVPRYLEELRQDLSAEENLKRLCFEREGLLVSEFDQIFHDLFLKKGPFYKELVVHLVDKSLSLSELSKKLGIVKSGHLSDALDELVQSGFLSQDKAWDLAKGVNTRTSLYRVRDNYLRFYVKYIQPHRQQIEAGQMQQLPHGWFSIMGLQFENLVVNNGAALCHVLEIPLDKIVMGNPFLQTPQKRRKGCQVDYMIQTRFNVLYVCEVRFRKTQLGPEIIEELKEKLSALKIPHGFSVKPVLIHVNGVKESVEDRGFFSRIVDFSELLLE